MVEERAKTFGSWQGDIGRNLVYGDESARERILTWLIDDGVASRGHRLRVMSQDYKVAGISCGPHPEYGAMCVLTLAGGFSDLGPAQAASSKHNQGKSSNNSETKPTKVTGSNKDAVKERFYRADRSIRLLSQNSEHAFMNAA